METKDWDNTYLRLMKYIIRSLDPENLSFYDYPKDDIVDSLTMMGQFEKELFKHPSKREGKIVIRYREFESICLKYIRKCKKKNNHFGGYIFFSIFQDLRDFFKVESRKRCLNNILLYEKDLSDGDFKKLSEAYEKYYKKEMPYKENDFKSIIYKGAKIFVYKPYMVGYLIDGDTFKEFDLVWDWWYPIEMYLYLEKGWKTND